MQSRMPAFPEPVQWVWDQFEPLAESVMRGCMEALPYGYSVQEAVYRYADDRLGRIAWAEITEKPFEWFIPRLDGTVLYRGLNNIQGEETDPRKFFLTARNQTYRQPHGSAIFSRLYWPWFFRQQGWRFWVRWLERFGTPLLVGKTQGNPQEMVDRLAEAVNGAVAAVGLGDDVQVVESSGGGTQFQSFDDQVCKRIQKIILGQTLTTDIQHRGSFAAAQVHNEVRIDRRNADIRMVTASVQRIITTLWELNNFPGPAPRFVLEDGQGLEVERSARDVAMVGAGILELTDTYLKRVYDFEDGDFIIPPKPDPSLAAPAAGGRPPIRPAVGAGGGTAASIFTAGRFTPQQQTLEDALGMALADLPQQAVPEASIRAAIKAATDPRDLTEKLAVLLRDADPRAFAVTLERALYAADLLGYVHAGAPLSQQPLPEPSP
jgi:phage gp29-like protein